MLPGQTTTKAEGATKVNTKFEDACKAATMELSIREAAIAEANAALTTREDKLVAAAELLDTKTAELDAREAAIKARESSSQLANAQRVAANRLARCKTLEKEVATLTAELGVVRKERENYRGALAGLAAREQMAQAPAPVLVPEPVAP